MLIHDLSPTTVCSGHVKVDRLDHFSRREGHAGSGDTSSRDRDFFSFLMRHGLIYSRTGTSGAGLVHMHSSNYKQVPERIWRKLRQLAVRALALRSETGGLNVLKKALLRPGTSLAIVVLYF